jgi:hypothetical protein
MFPWKDFQANLRRPEWQRAACLIKFDDAPRFNRTRPPDQDLR